MLAQIGDVVPRFKIYERLYPSHARLTQALSAAYFDVLEFCTAVKRVFKRAKRNVGRSFWLFHRLNSCLTEISMQW